MERLIKTIQSQSNMPISLMCVSGDGSHLLTAPGSDATGYELWDLATGDAVRRLTGLVSPTAIALDPTGRLAAACAIEAELVVWDTGTGNVVKRVRSPGPSGDNSGRVAFSPNGQAILAAYFGSITLFDTAASQKSTFRIQEPGPTLFSVAFAPGGALAALGFERSDSGADIKIYDLASEHQTIGIAAHKGTGVLSLAWSGDTILSGDYKGALTLTAATTGAVIRSFAGHAKAVTSVAVASGGRLAVSGGEDGAVKVWDVAGGGLLASLDHGAPVQGVAFMPDAKSVLSAGGMAVKQWSVSDLVA